MGRTALGAAYLQVRESRRRPVWWERNRRDLDEIAVVIAVVLRRNGNGIDVGAHVGDILELIAVRAPDGRHLAFEPIPERAEALQHRFADVDVRQIALSDRSGTAAFRHVVGADALSSIDGCSTEAASRPHEVVEVEVARLDDVLPSGYRPDFVKIDVEGAEALVMQGAVDTLRAHHPVLVFEHGGLGAGPARPGDVHPLLTDLGYEIFDIDGHGPYTLDEMDRTFDGGELWSWLALPRP